jgi:hypothetical protein
VAFSHFVQLVVPFGLFGPEPVAAVAGALIIVHQLVLIVSGNYAWLNWLTVVLGLTAFSDAALAYFVPVAAPVAMVARPAPFDWLLYGLAMATALLSIKPALNLLSKNQAMNASYNPLHLVGSYGAFGSVTRERYEVIVEGTLDETPTEGSEWRAYEFKAKPGDVKRRPPQWAPYHLRLDWLMWFLPLRVAVTSNGILRARHPIWFTRFVDKLLAGDGATLALLRNNPFPDAPPAHIRATFYRYELTSTRERREIGAYWKRRYIDEYLPARGRLGQ